MKDGGIIIPDSAVDRQTLNFKPSDSLIIMAKGDSHTDALPLARELNCECWGVNNCVRYPEMTMLFDLHEKERALKVSPDIPTLDIPVMMQERHADIPNSVRFPMSRIIETFGIKYFNNQICQMIAFAIFTRRFKTIYLFGVDYGSTDRVEQEFERPCTEFWIGFAIAKGINVATSQISNLMTYANYCKGVIYGYTENYQQPFKDFRKAYPHFLAEYILGHWGGGGGRIAEVYSHEEFYDELGKFCTAFIHKKLKEKEALGKEKQQVSAQHRQKAKAEKS